MKNWLYFLLGGNKKQMKNTKKFLPFLVTVATCLVIAVVLLIALPWLTPTKADTNTGKQTEENRNQIDENPSINDNLGDNKGDDNTTGGETTTPTDPTKPDKPTPTDPIDPDPDPTEPDPEPEPEPEPTFVLDVEHLRGKVWYDENKHWYLTFSEEGNKCKITNDEDSVILSGTWELKDKSVIFKPDSNIMENLEFHYNDDDLTKISLAENDYDYKFVLLTNA